MGSTRTRHGSKEVGTTIATWTMLGALVVLLTLADVFYTVLFPASGRGPVRKPLTSLTSRCFRALSRVSGRPGKAVLSYEGPVQVLVTLLAWLGLLTLGWALIYHPALGHQIRASSGPTDTGFATALYYSGFTLSTLGVGDVVAVSPAYRLLTVVQAATGFSVITLVITYFLSVYGTLPSRNAFALTMHHRSLGTDDAAVLVSALATDSAGRVTEHLTGTASFLRQMAEKHRSYPVLRYFHYREDYYALPVVMCSALDTVALVSSTLAPGEHDGLPDSSALEEMSLAAEVLLRELLQQDCSVEKPTGEETERWRRRHAEATQEMASRGVTVRTDAEAAEEYVRLRARWNDRLARLADEMAYEWGDHLRCPPRTVSRWGT